MQPESWEPPFHFEGRRFRGVENSATGEVGEATEFRYRQDGRLVWATYEGGEVTFGTVVARMEDDGSLDMRYQHLNAAGELMTGECRSRPEILDDGRYRVHETWRWTSGDHSSGTSVIEEIDDSSRL